MNYELYEGLSKLLGVLSVLATGTVGLMAVGVAIYCSLKKLRPAAAWTIAVSWTLMFLMMCVYLLGSLLLERMLGWEVMGWIYLLVDMFGLLVGLLLAVGFFLFKPLDHALPEGQEVGHG